MSSTPASAIKPSRKYSKGGPGISLYVGNLQPNITEARLLEKFSAVGAVCSIRICRDKQTKRFLGYAYVNFRRAEDATRALETMNGHVIGGRPIRVCLAERNAAVPAEKVNVVKAVKKVELGENNAVGIMITGLNESIRDGDLRAIFSSSGNILDCGVGRDDDGKSKGYGFVHYEAEESVDNCLKRSGLLAGTTLSVSKLHTNVHLYSFGHKLNFASLHDMFGPYGTITDYRVVTKYGKNRGFGYVTFKKLKSAAFAIAELNGKDLGDGFKLKVESAPLPPSKERYNPDEGVNLYIKIYESSITNDRLQELFSPFGAIISVKVLTGPVEGQRAAFVRFADNEAATKAIAEMNGKVVGHGPLNVSLAIVHKPKPAEQAPKPVSFPKKPILKPHSQDQQRGLADRLYLQVKQHNASLAGMITAKLLEPSAILQTQLLVLQPAALKAKVNEMVVALLLGRQQHLRQIESAPAGSAAA